MSLNQKKKDEQKVVFIYKSDLIYLGQYVINLPQLQYNKKEMDSMCTKCQKFFGAPDKQFMCSVCYKQHLKSKKIVEEIKTMKNPQPPVPPKQGDHSKCFICNKKIGILGFKCNQCDCSYCKNHRLPEDHQCKKNFLEQGKKEIEKHNQAIIAPKVEQI